MQAQLERRCRHLIGANAAQLASVASALLLASSGASSLPNQIVHQISNILPLKNAVLLSLVNKLLCGDTLNQRERFDLEDRGMIETLLPQMNNLRVLKVYVDSMDVYDIVLATLKRCQPTLKSINVQLSPNLMKDLPLNRLEAPIATNSIEAGSLYAPPRNYEPICRYQSELFLNPADKDEEINDVGALFGVPSSQIEACPPRACSAFEPPLDRFQGERNMTQYRFEDLDGPTMTHHSTFAAAPMVAPQHEEPEKQDEEEEKEKEQTHVEEPNEIAKKRHHDAVWSMFSVEGEEEKAEQGEQKVEASGPSNDENDEEPLLSIKQPQNPAASPRSSHELHSRL